MVTAQGFHDVGGKFITGDTDTLVAYNTCQRNHRNTGGSSADIDDHIAYGLFYVDTYTECSGHRLMDHIYFFRAGLFGTIAHGTFFYFGNRRWDTDHHSPARWKQRLLGIDHLDQFPDHQLGSVEIGNYAVFQRTHG